MNENFSLCVNDDTCFNGLLIILSRVLNDWYTHSFGAAED